jgi:hypothetical protein
MRIQQGTSMPVESVSIITSQSKADENTPAVFTPTITAGPTVVGPVQYDTKENRLKLENNLENYQSLKERALERGDMEGVSLYDNKIEEITNQLGSLTAKNEVLNRSEIQHMIQNLQQQKQQAVNIEDYELAKILKQKIQALTNKITEMDSQTPSITPQVLQYSIFRLYCRS